jgi:hypothetical protein
MPRRRDALFELTEAILTIGAIPSPVHLSPQPVHRRGWGRLYAVLSKGRADEEVLRDLLVRDHLPYEHTPVYAVDPSVWPRPKGPV